MSKTMWTPGPWVLVTHHRQGHDGLVPVWYIKAENDVGIAVQPAFSSPYHEEANARLIAAAPELYQALQAAVDCGIIPKSSAKDGGPYKHSRQVEVADMIRAALAKARGEQ